MCGRCRVRIRRSREAATYYDPNEVRVVLTFSSAFSGNLHLYAVDWDTTSRRETLSVNGTQVANLSADFSQGAWVTTPVSVSAGGTITVTVDRTAGANAVLSGIFWGDAGTPPPPTAQDHRLAHPRRVIGLGRMGRLGMTWGMVGG